MNRTQRLVLWALKTIDDEITSAPADVQEYFAEIQREVDGHAAILEAEEIVRAARERDME